MFKFPEFAKTFAAPAIDYKALVEIQQRNLDAVVAINAKLVEGAQEVLKRQAELLQASIKDGLEAARVNFAPANVTKVERHIEYFKDSAEKSVASARELAEMVSKTGNEAAEILRKRATESVGEISALVKTAA